MSRVASREGGNIFSSIYVALPKNAQNFFVLFFFRKRIHMRFLQKFPFFFDPPGTSTEFLIAPPHKKLRCQSFRL